VSAIPTPEEGAAGRIARQAVEEGADLILALGGDGTVNEMLPGVVHTDVPVAVIPAGTANVLTHELGLGTNALKAAARLGSLEPRRVAIGLLRCEPGPVSAIFWRWPGSASTRTSCMGST